MGRFLLTWLLPFFAAPIYWLYSRTWRLKITGDAQSVNQFVLGGDSCIYAHWHGDELVLLPFYAFHRLAVLSSLSADGQLMTNILRILGYRVYRGSSTRGGARGLIGLIRAVQSGAQSAVAVDGPKGPIYKVKPGVAELARKTGKPIICARCYVDRAWYIPRAWNKCFIPKPFAKIDIRFSALIPMTDAMDTEALRLQIEKILEKL